MGGWGHNEPDYEKLKSPYAQLTTFDIQLVKVQNERFPKKKYLKKLRLPLLLHITVTYIVGLQI